jgi:ABC-type sugar transport system substrate-binding protein
MDSKFQRVVARGRHVAIPLVAIAAVAGVGASSASAAAISNKELTSLKSFVSAAQAPPTWSAPGPAVKGSVLKGKTIVTFPISSEIDACTTQQSDFTAAATALGAKIDALPTGGTGGPPVWNSNLGDAANAKAAAVVIFCGASGAAMSAELGTLKSDHIPVVDGNYNQTEGNPGFPFSDLQGETGVNTAGGVEDDLADALVNLKGKPAHVLFLDSPSVAQYSGAQDGLKAGIKKWCPKTCTFKEDDVPVQDWGTDASSVASDLNANPNINAVIVTFDGMSDDAITQVQAAVSKHPGLKIYAWGGGSAEEKDVQNNPVFAADSGPDERWDAYGALDQVIRLVSGKSSVTVQKEVDPNVFFTKSNVKSFFTASGGYSDAAFGNGAFIKDFDKLWGVK